MRYVYLALAALFCVVAIAAKLVGSPVYYSLMGLVAAALLLFMAIRQSAPQPARPATLADLSQEQRAEIARLMELSQYGTAVSQVQLWFRNTSQADADAVVQAVVQASGKDV